MTLTDQAQALRNRLQQLRKVREVLPYLSEEQRLQKALFEARYRANRLKAPSQFGQLGG